MCLEVHSIQRFGVRLQRLDSQFLELVRDWRNSDFVRKQMVIQDMISFEQHARWYNSLNADSDHYYIIIASAVPAGVVNIKSINAGSGEGGLFIGNPTYHGSTVAMQSLLAMYEFGFTKLNLSSISARIRKQNSEAERLNLALGFRRVLPDNDVEVGRWLLTYEDFFSKTERVRAFFSLHSK